MTKRIMLVAGTRPELIKVYPVITALSGRSDCEVRFVWTGQHYDKNMSDIFFEELEIPVPDSDLDIGPGSQSEQCAKMASGLGKEIKAFGPDAILAEGDTNSVVEAGLAARREKIPFGHIEAGLRSYDRRMPEEINRCIAGICAEMSFAPTRNAALNLVHEGISPRRIFITGNTIVDMIVATAAKMGFRDVTGRFGFDKSGKNILMTLHRAENVDDPVRLRALAATAIGLSRHGHVIFPVHPRTVSRLEMFGLSEKLRRGSITMTEPVGYLDFLSLERMADLIVTDSGGVQEEALVLGTPAITLRDNTERPETVWSGGNYVSGTTPDFALVSRLLEMKRDSKKLNVPNALGDGNAGARIAEITLAKLEGGFALTSPDYRQSGSAVHRIIRVGAPFKVSDLEAQAAGLEVLVVYDYLGRPNLPYPERVLGSGDAIAVMGGEQCIEKATAMLKGAKVEEKVFT